MLTNKLPFTGENPVAIAMKHIEEEPIAPSRYRPQIPPMLEAIVCRAMSKSPEIRPSSFELVQELANVEAALSIPTKNDPDATRMLPRTEIPSRRTIRQGLGTQSAQQEEIPPVEPEEDQKPFYKSKLFVLMMALVLMLGFGVGIFAAFGKVLNTEETVTVPEVKGKQLALARQILEDNKLRVNVAETYDANVPAGQVVSQDPDVGKIVKIDRLVTIYVSKGGESIDMPDLAGLDKPAAIERIQKLGLNLGTVYEKDSSSEPGIVLSHDPATGTKITRGQAVDLVVSRGGTDQYVEEPPATQNSYQEPAPEPVYHESEPVQQESEPEPVYHEPEPDPEPIYHESEPEPEPEPVYNEPEPENRPQSEPEHTETVFPEIPTQLDVPTRDDQAKER